MSKKLKGNGLFESSRMMLPEHKEAYLMHQQNLRKNTRPQLDDQEMERISRLIAESMQLRKEITLVLFGELNRAEITGVVTKIDLQQKNIRITDGNGFRWIKLSDIIDGRWK
ncbi:YolD-like family protein [Paenibacillus sp. 3LSP]|uniref:YolD-like family protein n=1 Tax=Paenibacillus sp. 3LSP TaxID=2800795 RepID=UPI0028FD5687|nr:YolD-like family protein [Paenibacillus sp. 3LSP]MDU0333036.1 YolD-like family protein [Paenibacillus sp. 3LSP]